MLCENCLCAEVCDQSGRQLWGMLTGEKECSDFKDSTKYVEVVRCKDCDNAFCVSVGPNGQWVEDRENATFILCTRNEETVHVKADDFCSYGERREGE